MNYNIVVITLDAVRAQNLPFYGYQRMTTPFLTSMENELTVYENAISSSYWTMPSIASLFTGMYTSGHGLVADGDKLDRSLSTLPNVLRESGYRCAAFVRNVYVSDYSGLNENFHDFFSRAQIDQLKDLGAIVSKNTVRRLLPPGIKREPEQFLNDNHSRNGNNFNMAARLVDLFLDSGGSKFVSSFSTWLRRHKNKPFFAYFHFLETHFPYRAPFNFALRFLSPRDNLRRLLIDDNHLRFLLNGNKLTPKDLDILVAAYDNSLSYTDFLLQKIIHQLKRNGLYDDTLVVVLSDHGENIGDHGLMSHYHCLYDTLIKIPLLVKFPAQIGLSGRVADVAQNVDIFPTVLSLLGEKDAEIWSQIQGNDLLGVAPPKREPGLAVSELVKTLGPDRKPYRQELSRFDRRLLSLRTEDRKFIYSSRGDHECYDLANDPAESLNLYPDTDRFSDLMEKASIYHGKMEKFYKLNQQKIDGDFSEDSIEESVMERLKSLGYM